MKYCNQGSNFKNTTFRIIIDKSACFTMNSIDINRSFVYNMQISK